MASHEACQRIDVGLDLQGGEEQENPNADEGHEAEEGHDGLELHGGDVEDVGQGVQAGDQTGGSNRGDKQGFYYLRGKHMNIVQLI